MHEFNLAILVISLIVFFFGASMAITIKPASDGKSVSWKDINAIPMGVPFEIICRPVKLPDHALIQFFANQEILFIELPQPEPLKDFAPGIVLSKMEKEGQPFLQVIPFQRENNINVLA